MIATVLDVSDDFTIGNGVTVYKNVTVSVDGNVFSVTMSDDVTEGNIKTAVEDYLSNIISINDESGAVGLKIPLGDSAREVTGKEIFEWFTTAEWNALVELIRTGTVAQAGAADRFKTQVSGYWDTEIPVDNAKIVYYFNGLASLGVITNERRDEFLGAVA